MIFLDNKDDIIKGSTIFLNNSEDIILSFLLRKELNQMIQQNNLEGYVVTLTKINDNNENDNYQVKSEKLDKIIDSYKDLFPDKIPPGLLPKQYIDHAILLKLMSEYSKQKL